MHKGHVFFMRGDFSKMPQIKGSQLCVKLKILISNSFKPTGFEKRRI